MFCIKTEIRETPGKGKGVFARESVPKGAVVGILAEGIVGVMDEAQYQLAQNQGDEMVIRTAARWVDRYFYYADLISHEEYINHAFSPNMLYHCGVCFALTDIGPGDELTFNYQYLLAKDDVFAFTDQQSQQRVDGLPGRKALLQSARELVKLLESLETKD